jgi:hypothetical protein
MNNETYKENGAVLVDEFGMYFLNQKDITEEWKTNKGYKPFYLGSNGYYNNDSVMVQVKAGMRVLDVEIKELFNTTVKLKNDNIKTKQGK